MNSNFEELQSLTSNKKDFIDFNNPDDTNLVGEFFRATELENSYGKTFPTVYYDSGLEQFDSILNNSHEYDYGLTFNMARYLNGVLFSLSHPKNGDIKIGLWPHRIIKYETIENETVTILKDNKFLTMFSSGGFGQGAIGAVSSMVIGNMIQKIQGIQTKQVEGVRFKVYYLDKNDIEVCINFHSTKKNAIHTSLFLLLAIPDNGASTTLNSLNGNQNCYIATACYGDIDSYEVNLFRFYRDQYLDKTFLGRKFIKLYYTFSPYLVQFLTNHKKVNEFVKIQILDRILIKIIVSALPQGKVYLEILLQSRLISGFAFLQPFSNTFINSDLVCPTEKHPKTLQYF